MIECEFFYTNELLNKISKNSTKKINLITEIFMGIILIGLFVLFITSNILLGLIFCAIFAMLFASLFIVNNSVAKSNRMLLNQKINIIFNESNMKMQATKEDKVVYNSTFEYDAIKKTDVVNGLIYVYFNKSSAIVIPKLAFKTEGDFEKAVQMLANNYVI